MIICRQRMAPRQDINCDNCNRTPPFLLDYQITAETPRSREVTLYLCEDCSNAMSNLHGRVMENGTMHAYVADEIMILEDK